MPAFFLFSDTRWPLDLRDEMPKESFLRLFIFYYYYYYQSIYIAPHEERSALQKKKNEKEKTKIMETSEFSAASWT